MKRGKTRKLRLFRIHDRSKATGIDRRTVAIVRLPPGQPPLFLTLNLLSLVHVHASFEYARIPAPFLPYYV